MPTLHEAAETAYALGQTELAAAIRAGERELRAELEAAKKNDARYRWLRSRIPGSTYRIMGVIYSEGGAGVDAAIDAEMARDATHAAYMAASNNLGQECTEVSNG